MTNYGHIRLYGLDNPENFETLQGSDLFPILLIAWISGEVLLIDS